MSSHSGPLPPGEGRRTGGEGAEAEKREAEPAESGPSERRGGGARGERAEPAERCGNPLGVGAEIGG